MDIQYVSRYFTVSFGTVTFPRGPASALFHRLATGRVCVPQHVVPKAHKKSKIHNTAKWQNNVPVASWRLRRPTRVCLFTCVRGLRPSLLTVHTVLPTSLPVGRSVRKDDLTVHAQPDSRKGATPLSERQKALAAAAYLHWSRRGASRCEGDVCGGQAM